MAEAKVERPGRSDRGGGQRRVIGARATSGAPTRLPPAAQSSVAVSPDDETQLLTVRGALGCCIVEVTSELHQPRMGSCGVVRPFLRRSLETKLFTLGKL
jgi:hypothetical protein